MERILRKLDDLSTSVGKLEVSVARVDERLLHIEDKTDKGVLALDSVNKINTQLATIWMAVLAIPIIAAAVAFFMPEHPSVGFDRSQQ